jgi:ABC-2 type transport system ATP-binding protein
MNYLWVAVGAMNEVIVIEDLRKTYGPFVALNDLSLVVESGVCVGYLGPNGAGKTTTIKILTHLLRATSGKAYLNGADIVENPKRALEQVGAVVETPEFYPQLTPNECLSYIGHIRGMNTEAIQERSQAVLEEVKLSDWADQRTGKFSKGMKQRLAIAQALLHEPNILILDEPTTGLDPRGMFEVREIVRQLKTTEITILMSSHLLNEVQEVCDRVAIIDKGILLAYDTVENLSVMKENSVSVTTLEPITPDKFRALKVLRNVSSVKRVETFELVLNFKGGAKEQAQLLDDVIATGVEVVSFKPAKSIIEEIYLRLIPEEEAI